MQAPNESAPSDASPSSERRLSELVEEIVERGATTVEEIHRAIAELPLDVLDQLGLLPATSREVRRIQDVSLGAVYDAIREVNHKVARLAADLLEGGPPPGEPRG